MSQTTAVVSARGRIAVSGASGLIGTRVSVLLRAAGYRVHPLVRRPPHPGSTEIHWDPLHGHVDVNGLAGVDAVIHLAGENVGHGRWTAARKNAIRDSRVVGTALLAQALAGLQPPPRVLVAASAIGYYGDGGDEVLTESSPPGTGFLADVSRAWEAATDAARQAGIRTVNLRIGVVLAAGGGALAQMLTPFKLGLGGRIGSGRQWISWISLTDVARAIVHVLQTEDVYGAVNAVAPRAVTNSTFARTLAAVLRRPTLLPVPALAVRLLLGEMGRVLLLASAHVVPQSLQRSGFVFEHADLEAALGAELGLAGSRRAGSPGA